MRRTCITLAVGCVVALSVGAAQQPVGAAGREGRRRALRPCRLQAGFRERQLGAWTFENVYFYVYEQAVALEPDGHDLATLIWRHDYTSPLLSPAVAK